MRFMAFAVFGLFAVMAAGLVFAGNAARAADQTVDVGDFYFCSSAQSGQVCTTNVTAGDTVTWSVSSGFHTVTQCADAAFTSCGSGFNQQVSNGQTFAQTFSTAGTVYYRCDFHPGDMRGSVVVAAAATDAPTAAPTSPGSTATARPNVSAAPSTGGPLGGDSNAAWAYLLLALGGIAVGASAATFAIARRDR
jgi:plastocyanin